MERIENFIQYKTIIKKGKSLPHAYTNCYLMNDEVRKLIEQNKLYTEFQNGIVMILENRTFYWQLYYFLPKELTERPLMFSEPVITEFIYNDVKNQEGINETSCLCKLGFTLGREIKRMRVMAEEAVIEPSLDVSIADIKDMNGIEQLIRSNFHPYFSRISNNVELLDDIKNNKLFVIRKEDNVAAVLYAESNKNFASIRQVAVANEYRKKGYASQLISFYHSFYRTKVRFFIHWVEKENIPAINLYGKFGYKFDGRHAEEYIIE